MFRLKFNCPFGGHGYNVLWTGILLIFISVFMTVCNDGNIIAAAVIPALTVLIGGYLWINRITPLDRYNMDKAELPLWRPLTSDEREKVLKKKNFSFSYYIFMSAIAGILMVLPARNYSGFMDKYKMTAAVFSLIAIAVVMILDYINCLMWKSIDDTAVCAEVPISLHYSVEHYNRGSSWTNDYIVIYLPDGKYVLRSTLEGSQTVKLVRYAGMLTYFEDDADEDVLRWSN